MAPVGVVRYSNNPSEWLSLDGVWIDEQRPPGGIIGIPGNKVCIVAQFERGPVDELRNFGSTEQFRRTMGDLGPDANGAFYEGALSLRGKRWGRLFAIRVSNATMATATIALDDASVVNVLDITADSPGNWGNSLSAEIKDATSGVANEFNLEITRNGVIVETWQNLDLASVVDGANLAIRSQYVTATRIAIGDGRPDNVAATSLATGSDGTFVDADYVGVPGPPATGIQILYGDAASDIRWVFAGENTTAAVNGALELLATNGAQKNCIVAGPSGQSQADALTDVALYRSDRIGYVYPHAKIFLSEQQQANGGDGLFTVSTASFVANALASLAPGVNPAGPNGVPFLKGIVKLENPNLTHPDYVDFRANGIMGLQLTKESNDYEIRSGVNTSLDSALHNWARRTMADFIQTSAAQYLVTFRNKPINDRNKLQVKTALQDFLDLFISIGHLPNDRDLNENRPEGTPKLKTYEIDIASMNSPESEAEGIFLIAARVRILANMDFIVLRTEIGERVEVTIDGL